MHALSQLIPAASCFTSKGATSILTQGGIASVCKEKKKAQSAVRWLNREHREAFEYDEMEELQGRRIFDMVELPELNTLYLATNGHSDEPRLAAEHGGDFLIYAETEKKAQKYAVKDLEYDEGFQITGPMDTLADDADALRELVAKGKTACDM